MFFLIRRLTPLVLVALFIGGLVVVGRAARDHLRQQDRYQLAFREIDCVPPPGVAKKDFLDEVQYLAGLSDRVQLLDDRLSATLGEAFARHPWVEKVERVEIAPAGAIKVRLSYRRPVLAVAAPNRPRPVVVDGKGIVLPANAATEKLPLFKASTPPDGAAGTIYGNPAVEAAARKASEGVKQPPVDRARTATMSRTRLVRCATR